MHATLHLQRQQRRQHRLPACAAVMANALQMNAKWVSAGHLKKSITEAHFQNTI
jgi:hypothetical protein